MTDDAGREDDDGTDSTGAEENPPGAKAEPLPTKSMDETSEGGPADAAAVDEGEERSTLARAGTVVAWVLGVVLIGVGILGLSGGGPGPVPLVLGLVVTPRTRRELQELCRVLCG